MGSCACHKSPVIRLCDPELGRPELLQCGTMTPAAVESSGERDSVAFSHRYLDWSSANLGSMAPLTLWLLHCSGLQHRLESVPIHSLPGTMRRQVHDGHSGASTFPAGCQEGLSRYFNSMWKVPGILPSPQDMLHYRFCPFPYVFKFRPYDGLHSLDGA